jgi:hypothetical protein
MKLAIKFDSPNFRNPPLGLHIPGLKKSSLERDRVSPVPIPSPWSSTKAEVLRFLKPPLGLNGPPGRCRKIPRGMMITRVCPLVFIRGLRPDLKAILNYCPLPLVLKSSAPGLLSD